ncbi:MAG: glycoside hydrolase family 99-like domain-containing protein [Acetobacteraceae bacterium]
MHWYRYGWREDRWPNAYFDPRYYLSRNPEAGEVNPLIHYLEAGELAGRRPVPFFDPAWYRTRYAIPLGESCLAHFLSRRLTGAASPIAEFDSAYYLRENPDVAAVGMDPLEHYLVRGFAEERLPSPGFDTQRHRRSGRRRDPNPLLDLLLRQEEARQDSGPANIALEVRRRTRPHAAFEEVMPLPPGAVPQVKLLAYYLPQFHPVPENEAWWGRGFTEWTNLQRGLPRFAGHYQPRIPRDLGHYRLDQTDTMRRQIALAKGAGLHGFVFYTYWFNGRRLLEGPLEALLADKSLAFPFCLMWANENWTRRWDGSEDEVLLSQDYRTADEPALLAEFARHFADPRYIRLQGRPVLMIYRPRLIPDTAATIARWRRLFHKVHDENPVFVMAQSFGDADPRPFGLDAAVEFPPHKLTERLELVNDALDILDPTFSAEVYDYEALARASVQEPAPAYPLIKTAVPGWDNDPRRQGAGMVLHGATPAAYQVWLEDLIRHARAHPLLDESLVCINAWNEWAEGAYLEPDVHFGGAFLNATARAVAGLPAPGVRTRMLLVGHDAMPFGAQLLLLHIGRTLRSVHGVDIGFLLLGGGSLEADYRAVAPVLIAQGGEQLQQAAFAAHAAGCTTAIVNSAASAQACAVLKLQGIATTLLVHELPRLIREKGLIASLREAVATASRVVFPAAFVREQCDELVTLDPANVEIMPQGLYKPAAPNPAARAAIRAELRVPSGAILAVGMGYADLRKGFDLFLQVWRAACGAGRAVHLAWAGDMDPAMETYLGVEIAAAEAIGSFRYLGPREDSAAVLAAADVFLLTSREDPLPSVALEAMSAGVPVIAFEETGGVPGLLAEIGGGESVRLGDVGAMADALVRLAATFGPDRAAALAQASKAAFSFDRYCAHLLALAKPGLLPISVVVPSYNYGHYMAGRLASIFAQSYPVHEVIVLDDASTDGSATMAEETAAGWGRRIHVERQERNSGSVFAQWRRAAERATGEWLWIAEADDLSDPAFLATLVEAVGRAREPVLAFCDSCAIDGDGGGPVGRLQDLLRGRTQPGRRVRWSGLSARPHGGAEPDLERQRRAVAAERPAGGAQTLRIGSAPVPPCWRLAGLCGDTGPARRRGRLCCPASEPAPAPRPERHRTTEPVGAHDRDRAHAWRYGRDSRCRRGVAPAPAALSPQRGRIKRPNPALVAAHTASWHIPLQLPACGRQRVGDRCGFC